jgi:hypothetical protein
MKVCRLKTQVVSFRYDGHLYFNIAQEIVGRTVIVNTGSAATWAE